MSVFQKVFYFQVTGLPDHLLPKPPTRASPAFQKLKRSLSRSPSPIEYMKAVSTISSIIASNPTIDGELSKALLLDLSKMCLYLFKSFLLPMRLCHCH